MDRQKITTLAVDLGHQELVSQARNTLRKPHEDRVRVPEGATQRCSPLITAVSARFEWAVPGRHQLRLIPFEPGELSVGTCERPHRRSQVPNFAIDDRMEPAILTTLNNPDAQTYNAGKFLSPKIHKANILPKK